MTREEQDALLDEAIKWKPSCGERVRPERLWRAIMDEPEKKTNDSK